MKSILNLREKLKQVAVRTQGKAAQARDSKVNCSVVQMRGMPLRWKSLNFPIWSRGVGVCAHIQSNIIPRLITKLRKTSIQFNSWL